MFDPVSLIVGALVSGLTAGIESSVQDVVQDGVLALRRRLAARYGPRVEQSIERLETDPNSEARQGELAVELRQAGAAADPELAQLARRITSLIDEPFGPRPDPLEHAHRSAGLTAINQLLDNHVRRVLQARSQYAVDDQALLSSRVGQLGSLPPQVRTDLAGLQSEMRRIIGAIAANIEQSRYRDMDIALDSMGGGLADRQRAVALIQADKSMHISYETLRLTVEFFSELNQGVLARIQRETSARHEANMVFGNALLILELTDFVISFIEDFQLTNTVESLHAEAQAQASDIRRGLTELREFLESPGIEPAVRSATLGTIENQEAALLTLDEEWERYVADVTRLHGSIGAVRGMLPTLQVIRKSAQLQIKTLQAVALLSFLRTNSDSIRSAVSSLQGFRLAPLTPSRVRRLLGV